MIFSKSNYTKTCSKKAYLLQKKVQNGSIYTKTYTKKSKSLQFLGK